MFNYNCNLELSIRNLESYIQKQNNFTFLPSGALFLGSNKDLLLYYAIQNQKRFSSLQLKNILLLGNILFCAFDW